MKKVILVRYGEILLKGLNRPIFEDKLMSNIKRAIHKLGKVRITKSQARIYIEPLEENYDFDEALKLCQRFRNCFSKSGVEDRFGF